MTVTTLLLLLVIIAIFGGGNYIGGPWAGPGNLLGLVLLVFLIALVVRGV